MDNTHAASPGTRPDKNALRGMIARRAGPGKVPERLRIITDTSNFGVDYDNISRENTF
jgi:hypothetical protein